MKSINKMKEVAKNNCGACGDATASNEKYSIVCFSMTDGGFVFNVYVDGKPVAMSELEINGIIVSESLNICGPYDSRNLAA